MTDTSGEEKYVERRERRTRRHSTRKVRDHESSDRDVPRIEELRKARTDFYTIGGASSRRISTKGVKMPSASASRTSLSSTKSGSRHKHKSRRKHSSVDDESHRQRKSRTKETREKVSTETYVYEVDGEKVTETRTTYIEKGKDSDDAPPDEEEVMSDIQEEPEADEKKLRIIYVTKDKPRSSRHGSTRREGRDRPNSDVQYRSGASSKTLVEPESSASIKRSSSRHVHSADIGGLRRSQSHAPRSRPQSYPESTVSVPNRRSSVFSGFFNPQTSHQPIKLTECTVCLADDIPSTKCAKLKCGHRMCHSCLKRNFKLSVTDPQHMPPRCCTTDHIPLHHVDNLFDISFKKTWNRKFQEYTTKNRIYCPSKRCGEWIKPGNIHKEKDGKKQGVCPSCKAKVCCVCNGKWHGSKDCPKDEETNRLLETAKQSGWQRCYNCRTMVELKEGCNHMTCRCRAEFCMVCGLKWKTCNCQWFNYDTVENDRLNHMRIPDDPFLFPNRRPRELRPRTYDDEISSRRRQERADEVLARRLSNLGIYDYAREDDYNGGIGDIMGIGNGAGHFMNESFRRPGAINYVVRDRRPPPALGRYIPPPSRQTPPSLWSPAPPRSWDRETSDRYRSPGPPPPAPIRREIIEETVHVIPTPSRVPALAPIPAPPRDSDRGSKAGDPNPADLSTKPERTPRSLAVARERPPPADNSPGSSELAGLNTRGSGGGSGRVKAWRSHVEPGVEPVEGVLSM